MSPKPTGTVFATATGSVLTLARSFDAPAEDVWASVTEPDRLGRWFGSWTGDAGPGQTVTLTMSAEEGAPTAQVLIVDCVPTRHLAVQMVDASGTWDLELHLAEAGGRTTLELTHHLAADAAVGEVGPGWEYYLDRLVASRNGDPMPDFDSYYPALKRHYEPLKPTYPERDREDLDG